MKRAAILLILLSLAIGLIATPITVTSTITNVACNGLSTGAITITAAGGGTSYTYLWSNSAATQNIASLTAGSYTVTVTDNLSATTSATFAVTQPTYALSAVITKTDITCNGLTNGILIAAAAGGTATYTYSWNTGPVTATITGLSAAIYTVVITDGHSCTASGSSTITEPTTLSLSVSENSNTATTTVSGGTLAYSYLWSNAKTTANITVATGTYVVTLTDGRGCTKSYSITSVGGTASASSLISVVTMASYADSLSGATTKYYVLPVITQLYAYALQVQVVHVSGSADSTHVEFQGSMDNSVWYKTAMPVPAVTGGASWRYPLLCGQITTTDGGFLYQPTNFLRYKYFRLKVQHYTTGVVTVAGKAQLLLR